MDPTDISVINFSAQQHGHVFLNGNAGTLLQSLNQDEVSEKGNLQSILADIFALPFARIWRTSNTTRHADFVRDKVGGKKQLIELSGSNAPLRFSAFGICKTAEEFPEEYSTSSMIHQLNSLAAAVLTGNASVPLDYGNACGVSLMDYRKKTWSPELAAAVAEGLPGGENALLEKLPPLKSALTIAGPVAKYFSEKYSLSPKCIVGVGSGDNPQSKVLVDGSLLSLGTSLVIMAETDGRTFDLSGAANAMYDALDRPFMFGCRTNGALRWDNIRAMHGVPQKDYAPGEEALRNAPPGNSGKILLWQAEEESFPVSGVFGPVRLGYEKPDLATDYPAIVESTLAAVYIYSRDFMSDSDVIYVTGGAASSREILRRIAAMWRRSIVPTGAGGAALGAAVSGAYALLAHGGKQPDRKEFTSAFINSGESVTPNPDDIEFYHSEDGYLKKINAAFKKYIKE
ncbi:MAG: FGGY family carbohydrate kinase [Planctomycetota bacterium]